MQNVCRRPSDRLLGILARLFLEPKFPAPIFQFLHIFRTDLAHWENRTTLSFRAGCFREGASSVHETVGSRNKSKLLPCFSREHCGANPICRIAPSQLKTAHPLASTWYLSTPLGVSHCRDLPTSVLVQRLNDTHLTCSLRRYSARSKSWLTVERMDMLFCHNSPLYGE
jgi:hypothetical protein